MKGYCNKCGTVIDEVQFTQFKMCGKCYVEVEKKCKFGKWIYSKVYGVRGFHCCYGKEQGCYFENCQEECPNFIEVDNK